MFSAILKEHAAKKAELKRQADACSREIAETTASVTEELLDSINQGVAEIHSRQAQIEAEAKALHKETAQLSKQTTQWLKLYDGFAHALKELGDIENWTKVIETDLGSINNMLQQIAVNNNIQTASKQTANIT
eukprot:GILJ01010183.1.p1 GENE.GILJ01010183.1~~GILJ01010183.1.p1  ORF type:complete len:133 (-),score=24.07 GILJ01010183.1:128-526(-)